MTDWRSLRCSKGGHFIRWSVSSASRRRPAAVWRLRNEGQRGVSSAAPAIIALQRTVFRGFIVVVFSGCICSESSSLELVFGRLISHVALTKATQVQNEENQRNSKKKCSLLWPPTSAVDGAADIARKPLKKLSTVGLSKSEAPMRQTFVGGAVEPTGSSCCISFLMFVN